MGKSMKRFALAFLIGLFGFASFVSAGQGFSSRKLMNITADGAKSVFAVDLDRDGDLDVLSISSLDGRLLWYENSDGEGAFGPAQEITTLAGISAVYAGDFDTDGDPDIIISAESNLNMEWYENTAEAEEGEYSSQFLFHDYIASDSDSIRSIIGTDLDRNSTLDLISASDGPAGELALYSGSGDGDDFSESWLASDFEYLTTAAGDFDGDGDQDLAAAGMLGLGGMLVWYENIDGEGTLSVKTVSDDFGPITAIAAADLDGDGDLDLVGGGEDCITCDGDPGFLAWFENFDGDGSFDGDVIAYTDPVRSLATADVDGDGRSDILAA